MSVKERVEQFRRQWPMSDRGPAHVVISDLNVEDYDIDYCLGELRKYRALSKEWEATEAFLLELKAIPEDERIAEFEDEEA